MTPQTPNATRTTMPEKIRIGVSSCLLGQEVRYDGGHKHDPFLTDTLGPYVEWVPVCPEIEIGMGVPREAVRLEGPAAAPRMVGIDSGQDWTDRMLAYSKRMVRRLGSLNLSGYVLKSRSPSCGIDGVKLYSTKGKASKAGVGLFARELIAAHPLLPVEEEGRLGDPRLRDNFILRVFAFRRLQRLMDARFTIKKLMAFHAAERYLLLAHSPRHYRALSRLAANAKKSGTVEVKEGYAKLFMACLAVGSTVGKNVGVLRNIAAFLPARVPLAEREEILKVIGEYRGGVVPLVVPVMIVRHCARSHEIDSVSSQTFLDPYPHPIALQLRNRV